MKRQFSVESRINVIFSNIVVSKVYVYLVYIFFFFPIQYPVALLHFGVNEAVYINIT